MARFVIRNGHQAWLDSPERQKLLDEAAGFTEEFHACIARIGFDQWFPSVVSGAKPPATWKMNMLVLLMLYPVVFWFGAWVQTPLLSGRHEPLEPARPEPDEGDAALQKSVLEALTTVRDPEMPVNLVDLGLIYDLVVRKDGMVYVEMTLTTPACPVATRSGSAHRLIGSRGQRGFREAGLVAALDARSHEPRSQARARAPLT